MPSHIRAQKNDSVCVATTLQDQGVTNFYTIMTAFEFFKHFRVHNHHSPHHTQAHNYSLCTGQNTGKVQQAKVYTLQKRAQSHMLIHVQM